MEGVCHDGSAEMLNGSDLHIDALSPECLVL